MAATVTVAYLAGITRLAGAQASSPPAITTVAVGDAALTISWSAPSGVAEADIVAYDIRYIETSADEDNDALWSTVGRAWTEGPLHYVLAGLTNQVEYDVQVRALTVTIGDWSASSTGRPADHGASRATATAIGLEALVGGHISSPADVEFFRLTVSGRVNLLMHSTGTTELNARLLKASGAEIESSIAAEHLSGANNFLVGSPLSSGTYYLEVQGRDGDEGAYVVHTSHAARGDDFEHAVPIELNSVTYGVLDGVRRAHNENRDFYRFDLDASTDLLIHGSGPAPDTVGALYDSDKASIAENDDGYLAQHRQFALRIRLDTGTYYVSVRGYSPNRVGLYALHVHEVAEPGSTPAAAAPLAFGGAAAGTIASASDVDYFRVEVPETTLMQFRGTGIDVALNGAVLDANLDEVAGGTDQSYFGHDRRGVEMDRELEAGTYYFRVDTSGWDPDKPGKNTGAYAVTVFESSEFRELRARCGSPPTGVRDPLWGCQWHLENTGQFGGRAGEDINVVDAWSTTLGSSVNVAIVDGGVDYDHQDLADNLDTSMSHDYLGGRGSTGSLGHHGTAVAGLVAASDNSFGVRGVAPNATIRGFNLISRWSLRNEADAMTRNASTTAANSNSWGPADDGMPHRATRLWELAIESALTTGDGGRGTFYAWAAGNGRRDGDDSNLDEYANFWGVTAVCAVNNRGRQAGYSESGANLWVCAPSGDGSGSAGITSTTANGHYTSDFSGTSAATPQVTGVAALVRSANRLLTWRDVKLILAGSARRNDTTDAGWLTGEPKYESTSENYEFNHRYGFGVVDANAAVELAQGWTNVPELVKESSGSTDAVLIVGDRATVEQSVDLGAGVQFTEFVEVNIVMEAADLRSLDLELVSPAGTVSELLAADTRRSDGAPLDADDGAFRLGSARHLGEDPIGRWTLRVRDQKTGGFPVRVSSWSITVYGHRSTPGPPAITEADAETDPLTVNVTWHAPRSAGRSAVTSYDVRYISSSSTAKADDTAWTTVTGATTSATLNYAITGLAQGVLYDIEVRAVSAQGAGAWSPTAHGQDGATFTAPQFDAAETGVRDITENAQLGTSLGTRLQVSDDDGDDLTFALSGVDSAAFTIDNQGVLYTNHLIDYESQQRYTFEVSVVDDDTLSDQLQVTVNVINVNETPKLSRPRFLRLRENDDAPIGYFIADDPEGDDLTWSVSGPDAQHFVADGADTSFIVLQRFGHHAFLRFLDPADFEMPVDTDEDNVYDVTVEVSDGTSTARLGVEVTVDDEDEPPELSGVTSAIHPENDTTDIAEFAATDPEGKRIRWNLSGTDDDLFSIVGGTLRFIKPPDFEEPDDKASISVLGTSVEGDNIYDIEVWAYDDVIASILEVTVVVTNVDESPTVTLTARQPVSGSAITAAFSDPDGNITDLAWSWQWSTDRASWTPITNADTATYAPSAADIGRYLRASASYSDGHGSAKTAQLATADVVRATAPTNRLALFAASETGVRAAAENAAIGTNVGARVTATDGDRDSLTYSLSGPDAASFDIVTTTGQLRTTIVHDYEDTQNKRLYSLTVSVSDGKDADGSADPAIDDSVLVTVVITDVDEAPTLSGPASVDRPERDRHGVQFVADDPENRTLHWTLAGTDATDFWINPGGEMTFRRTPSYKYPADSNRDNVYRVSVSVSDGVNTERHTVSVTVTDVNEAPSILFAAERRVTENSAERFLLSGSDPEDDALTWSLAGSDVGALAIDPTDRLYFPVPPDFEARSDSDNDNDYQVTLSLSDGEFTTTRVVTLSVLDDDEAPVISGDKSPMFDEGETGVVASYSAQDPEGVSVAWLLGGVDAGAFELSASGELSFITTPDFEAPADADGGNDYQVQVIASDGSLTDTEPVTVSVVNVDEPGTLTLSANQPQASSLLEATLKDPDGAAASVTWGWERRLEGQLTWGPITGADNSAYTPTNADINYWLRATASYRDAQGTNKSANATSAQAVQAAAPMNHAPSFPASETGSRSVTENAAPGPVGDVFTAVDVDDDQLTYSLVNADTGVFDIDDSSGQMRTLVAVDRESARSYSFKVRAEDPSGSKDDVDVTVVVVDVDERPSLRGPATANVAEASSRAVASYIAADPEGVSVTWSLAGVDGGAFEIVGGSLRFTDTPDHEAPADINGDNLYLVTVVASDGDLEARQNVRVTVIAVNEVPVITGDFTPEHAENTAAVASYQTTDPEGGEVDFSLEGVDSDALVLTDHGALVFLQIPDFESPADSNRDNRVQIELVADDGRNVITQQVTIIVTNADDPGTVTLSTTVPVIASSVDADLEDIDGSVSAVSWQWSTSTDRADWTDVALATSLRYTPTDADEGRYLRATATYRDRLGPGHTAHDDSDEPVFKAVGSPTTTTTTTTGGGGGGSSGGGGGSGGSSSSSGGGSSSGGFTESTATLIVANGWSPPDIGVAAALAARTGDSAVIYTASDRLSTSVRKMLSDYLPAAVVVVGGESAVSADVLTAMRRASQLDAVARITGATRVGTAAEVAQQILDESKAGSGATTVIVANGWSPSDIGVAAALSARTPRSAVVYTQQRKLSDATRELLSQYGPDRVMIVGGEAAVGGDVEARIRSVVPSAAVERVSGTTRTGTAAGVARGLLGPPESSVFDKLTIILTNGWSPPDIGVAAALSARTDGSMVLYTEAGRLSSEAEAVLRDYQPARIVFIGGTAAITSTTKNQARAVVPDASGPRYSGSTRTQTAVDVARRILGNP